MSPLTVLQIHNAYREVGGEDTVVRRERDLLRAAGHEVVAYGAENPRGRVNATVTMLASPWNTMSARRAADAVRRQRPDVAHVHNTWWALSASIVRPLAAAGIPIVMTLHNYRLLCANAMLFRDGRPCEECVGTHPWRAVGYTCYRDSFPASFIAATAISLSRRRQVWQDVDVFLALTEFARERFIAGGLPPDKLIVKPNFVDDPGPRRIPPSRSSTVLYVGRLSEEKGIDLLLDAWREAALDKLRLLVVGDGPLRGVLEASAPSGVQFLGRVTPDRVRDLMLEARALVFPSLWYEGQPMVLLEALAAGAPLVACAMGGVIDTIGDRSAAVQAAPGDLSDWKRALWKLTDDAWVDEAGAHARDVFEARYVSQIALDNLIGVYRRAIENHPGSVE